MLLSPLEHLWGIALLCFVLPLTVSLGNADDVPSVDIPSWFPLEDLELWLLMSFGVPECLFQRSTTSFPPFCFVANMSSRLAHHCECTARVLLLDRHVLIVDTGCQQGFSSNHNRDNTCSSRLTHGVKATESPKKRAELLSLLLLLLLIYELVRDDGAWDNS